MELLILTIVVLLVVIVVQWARFSSVLEDKEIEIAKMRDINHALSERLINLQNTIKTHFSETMKNGALGK